MQRGMRQKLIIGVMLILCAVLGISGIGAAEEGNSDYPLVGEIVVEGHSLVSESLIRAHITHTTVGETVDEEKIQQDLQDIADTGYFLDVRAAFAEVQSGLRVIFTVVENPVVTKVQIINDILPVSELQGYMNTRPGRILNVPELYDDIRVLVDKSFTEYNLPIRVDDLVITPTGEVRVVINETHIGEVIITGNDKTKDYVIRRELQIEPGDVLDMKAVNQGLRRVLMLGHFDEVGRDFEDTQDPDRVNLIVKVVERKTGVFGGGAGWSSQEGFIGYVEVEDQNFLGRGERVNLRWEFGQKRNNYDLGFFEPYVNKKGMFMGVNLYNRSNLKRVDKEYDNHYARHRTGGDLTVGQPVTENTTASLRFKLENTKYDLDMELSENPGLFELEDGTTRSLRLQTVTNTTDHPFFPSAGMKNRLSVELGGYMLGGDNDFIKYEADLSKYVLVGSNNQTAAFRINTGVVTGDQAGQERFEIGGSETVRGYGYGEFQGEKALVINGEYRFPVMKAVHGVVFVDAGNAWKADESMGLGDLHAGYGVGVRLDTPIGVIRIDYGIGEEGGRTYLSFGQTF